MAHHAYLVAGHLEEGVARALRFVERDLKIKTEGNPDVVVTRHGLFSVDDARATRAMAERAPLTGDIKVLVIATGRIFHEAQNALLKLFEEPPKGVFLIVVVPSKGMLLPTLRSRIIDLPKGKAIETNEESLADTFIGATKDKREKIVAKLLERAKSDKDEEKQAARLEALALLEGLMRAAYAARLEAESPTTPYDILLTDLNSFISILHDRSAPLKPIFEHVLLTIPSSFR